MQKLNTSKLEIKLRLLEFRTLYSGNLGNINIGGEIKVDTGCQFTAISLGDVLEDTVRKELLLRDATSFKNTGFPEACYSIGVNTRDLIRPDLKRMSIAELMSRKDVCFFHKFTNFIVNGFNFGDVDVRICYNRNGHSLLGMNILENYDSNITLNEDEVTVFRLQARKKSKDRMQCARKLRSLLSDKLSLKEAEISLFNDFDEDTIHSCMFELLQNHNVIDGKL